MGASLSSLGDCLLGGYGETQRDRAMRLAREASKAADDNIAAHNADMLRLTGEQRRLEARHNRRIAQASGRVTRDEFTLMAQEMRAVKDQLRAVRTALQSAYTARTTVAGYITALRTCHDSAALANLHRRMGRNLQSAAKAIGVDPSLTDTLDVVSERVQEAGAELSELNGVVGDLSGNLHADADQLRDEADEEDEYLSNLRVAGQRAAALAQDNAALALQDRLTAAPTAPLRGTPAVGVPATARLERETAVETEAATDHRRPPPPPAAAPMLASRGRGYRDPFAASLVN